MLRALQLHGILFCMFAKDTASNYLFHQVDRLRLPSNSESWQTAQSRTVFRARWTPLCVYHAWMAFSSAPVGASLPARPATCQQPSGLVQLHRLSRLSTSLELCWACWVSLGWLSLHSFASAAASSALSANWSFLSASSYSPLRKKVISHTYISIFLFIL